MVKSYHSYTKDQRYLIADMHPSHIVNALAVINDGRHPRYYVGDPVYQALVRQLLVTVKDGARKRAAAKAHQSEARKTVKEFLDKNPYFRVQHSRGYATLGQLRAYAVEIAKRKGTVAADSLRVYTALKGYEDTPGLDYMNVLRGRKFVPVGMRPSAWPSARGRKIQVYALA